MPKRSRRGEDSMPGRVVAATRVKGRRGMRMVRACRPLSMTKLTVKSSMAGYRSSSTTRGRRWISSTKRMSRSFRLVRMPMRSPPRSSDGRRHLVGQDGGQRGLAQAGRPGEQHMIERLAALARRLDGHAEALHGRSLPYVLIEVLRAKLALEARLLGKGGAAHHARVVGGHAIRSPHPSSSAAGGRGSRRLGSAVDLVEEILGRGDAGLAAERG